MSYKDLYRKTTMPDLLEKLQNHYGTEIGQSIFADSCTRLAAALDSVDIKGNKAIERHLTKGILPSGACYLSLIDNGVPQGDALGFVAECIASYAKKTGLHLGRLCKWMPFFLIKRTIRLMIAMGYPSAGWKLDWKKTAPTRLHLS